MIFLVVGNNGRKSVAKMKRFNVTLKLRLGRIPVEADRFVHEGIMLRFYSGDTMVAEYVRTIVLEVHESQNPDPVYMQLMS